MNERIQELMGKTLDSEFSHTWDTMTYEGLLQFSEKFAELIVRECARVVDEKLDFENAYGPDDWAEGADLLNHFGVEE